MWMRLPGNQIRSPTNLKLSIKELKPDNETTEKQQKKEYIKVGCVQNGAFICNT